MTPHTFGRAAGLGCLMTLMFAGACEAQMVELAQHAKGRVASVFSAAVVDRLAEYHGVTFCRDRGSVWFVRGGMSEMDEADTKAHEQKHMEQHARYGNCADFFASYYTPKGQLDLEAEAFHAGWCVSRAMGADSASLRSHYIQVIRDNYVPGTHASEIAAAFDKWGGCASADTLSPQPRSIRRIPFSDADCRAYYARSLVAGGPRAAHEAVLEKWKSTHGNLSPGELSEAFMVDCKVSLP